ncbi:serine hydrolase domain-containing protein [Bradyrhizobium sp. SYSU BS000235]|uniref:serine hydrolase domain-containing protein n=1 Tax=Bradyrhizobium sp. SYSU BS000235 TaxID=3411332 RepID=UPI003C746089
MSPITMHHAVQRNGQDICASSDALFPWWSITKPVLAAAVLRLVDRGRVDLDQQYDDKPYSIRQLLQHTAGLSTYGGAAYHDAVASHEPVWPVEELLRRVQADRLIYAPGQGWAYSNVGYLLVRQFIEQQMNLDLNAALSELVFNPMGLQRSRIATTPADMAETYWGNSPGYDPRWVYHGLLIGPPSDAVRFLDNLQSDTFLSERCRLEMLGEHPLNESGGGRPWTRTGYGFGLMIGEMGEAGRVCGHTGGGNASVSALYRFSDIAGAPIVAVFDEGTDGSAVEWEAVRLALQS